MRCAAAVSVGHDRALRRPSGYHGYGNPRGAPPSPAEPDWPSRGRECDDLLVKEARQSDLLGENAGPSERHVSPRILFFDGVIGGSGGAQRSNLYLAAFLHRRGYPTALLYGRDGDLSRAWSQVTARQLALGSVRLPRRNPIQSGRLLVKAVRFARSWGPDLVYCYSFDQLPLAAAVARWCRVPILYHIRTPIPRLSGRNRRRMKLPAEFVAVSRSTMEEHSRLLPDLAGRCTVVHNGVDLARFTPLSSIERGAVRGKYRLPLEAPIVGFFGRIAPDKGLQELVEAHARMAADTSAWLVIVGGSSDERERAFDESIREVAGDKVVFLGHQDAVAELMASVDVIAMPSHQEPFGRVAIEGLACGVPVVATAVGGLPEILGQDFPENLVPVGDELALEGALRRVIASPPAAIQPAFYRACAERFSIERVHEQLERIIRRVAG